jgi:DNA-binding NarL/FixJ family response regulator
LRSSLAAFAGFVRPEQREAFALIEVRLASLDQAVAAANDLAVTVDQSGRMPGAVTEDVTEVPGLTGRQLEILRLAARGRPNREIGRSLGLSEGTIKQHMTRIFRRLDVKNRTEAVDRLRAAGLSLE